MSLQGHIVQLSSVSYQTPNCCSSCMGPRTTEVKAQMSEKAGNIRTTLTMGFPYCETCAKRARWDKVFQIIVGVAAAALGTGLAAAAWLVEFAFPSDIRFALALPLSAAFAFGLVMATRPALPAAPATARGEAVILRDTSGTVLCTNPQFAELLARANGCTAKPGTTYRTPQIWGPLTALLCGVLVLLMWLKAGSPPGSIMLFAEDPKPSRTAPKKPVPPAPAPKKR